MFIGHLYIFFGEMSIQVLCPLKKKIYLSIFGHTGSSLLHELFSSCSEQGLLSSCGAWASHCGGFSCCRAWALGYTGCSSCGSRALEHGLNSWGTWA